jgi:diguanylate cyclase (GGDEF)-like protein
MKFKPTKLKLGKGLRFVLSLSLLCFILAVTVFQINKSAVEKLLVQEATEKSLEIARMFERGLPTRINDGKWKMPSESEKIFLRHSLELTGADRFKRYDAKGMLILDSTQLASVFSGSDKLGKIEKNAIAAMVSGLPKVTFESEEVNGQERLISETYIAVHEKGKVVGAAEVYFDLTEHAAMFHRSFGWYTAMIACLAALGFAVPAAAFHVKDLQKTAADENVQFLATHDPLTRLQNRVSFNAAMTQNLKSSLERGEVSILHFIDLDGFKEINDRHGHIFGDDVLRIVAERLKNTLRAGDIASRFGGDEFVVAQFGFTSNEDIRSATARIASVFKSPLKIDSNEIAVTASIGTAVSPQHGITAEDLIARADTSVYVVKARGRNDQVYFEPRFDEDKQRRIRIEERVREAVANKLFHLNFQPLVQFPNCEIKGFESLLRLRDSDGKAISPVDFIPVAEDLGLIDEIGDWVMLHSCLLAATWPNHLQISVNLSVAQFKHRSIVASTRAALAQSHLEPHRLVLEITESLLMTETQAILEQLRELKALGVSIAMDDFGTGYSSLGYMLKFPFDRLKIDRSFVTALATGSAEAFKVVQTIIALGHTLKMSVTAEGVETQAQADALRDMGCNDGQGYLFGRPIPSADIPALLLKNVVAKNKLTTPIEIQLRLEA